jgi:predicted TIM-barrel fold metal-dependent hydrolase
VHPEARDPGFAEGSSELVRRDVYASPDIEKAVGLWSAERLIQSMDESGIDYALVRGLAWKSSSILGDNNSYVDACLAEHPDRLKGLHIADAGHPDEAADAIMALDETLYVGVELIPKWQGTQINAPELQPIIDAVQKRDFLLKVYTAHPTQTLNGDAPYRTLEFLRKHPEIKILVPHLGGLLCLYKLFPPIAECLNNAYFIGSVSATMQMVEFAARVDSNNLLFGTDFPFNHSFDQQTALNAFAKLDIPADARARILGDNALKLFGFRDKPPTTSAE